MDRLPPELLGMIADLIQHNSLALRGQRDLSALARTNKTLYSICNPKLYQHPICRDSKAATKWSKFYTSSINPWNMTQGSRGLADDMLPRSISFEYLPDRKAKSHNFRPVAHSRHLPVPTPEFRVAQLATTPAIFSNLTSFSVPTNFISNHAVKLDFLATLFGPVGSNRTIIRHLDLALHDSWPFTPFLLESVNRIDWVFDEATFQALLVDILEAHPNETAKAAIIRRMEEEGEATLDGDVLHELDETAFGLASTRYDVFRQMSLNTVDPVVVLPLCISSRDLPCHPLNSLRKLSIAVDEIVELYLIFHSRLFPSLIYLKISGSFEASEASSNLEYNIKLLRLSITKRNGVIHKPEWAFDDDDNEFGEMPEDWTALSKEEIDAEPKIAYIGPDLEELDLSEMEMTTIGMME
ncbi:hypothetical protein JCM5350_003435 [Sporobolomyces pararoseus]